MGDLQTATTSSQPQNTRKQNRMRQPTCLTRTLPIIFVAFTFLLSTQSVLILAEQSISLIAECEKGSSPVFLLQHNSTNGVQIRPLPASNFLECSEYCSNANDCVGVEYSDGLCRILGASASGYEQGNGQVITKSCVKSERICASPFHFDVHEQMVLVGFAREVVPSDTIQVCLSACLNAFDTFGFECESVLYYPVHRECILNTEDRLDRPDLFLDEHEDQVIYLDNNCAGSSKPRMTGTQLDEDDTALANNEALKQQLEKSKAEVYAAQTRIKDFEESTFDLKRKLQSAEAQRQLHFERNRQLTAELHTLENKNRETLKRNCKLEKELSDLQAKARDLEAKFDQTDVSHVIGVVNSEILRLQKEVAKLSIENETKKQELNVVQKRLAESEKRNEAEQKRSQDRINQMKIETDSMSEQIRKKNVEAEKLSCGNDILNNEIKRSLKNLAADLSQVNKTLIDQNNSFAGIICQMKQKMAKLEAKIDGFDAEKKQVADKNETLGNELQKELEKCRQEARARSSAFKIISDHLPLAPNSKGQNQESGSDGGPTKRKRGRLAKTKNVALSNKTVIIS